MTTTSVLVAGTYAVSDAYPNVKYRVELLHSDRRLRTLEVHRPLRTGLDYSTRARTLLSAVTLLARMALGTASTVVAFTRHRHVDVLYVPYPAVHLLWIASFLPRRLLPRRVVADVFISLHDTVVNDRALLRARSPMSRALFAIERRAFAFATVLLTDTPENARFYAEHFGVERSRFVDVPLSTDGRFARARRSGPRPPGPLRLLFVGTLVPLHGIRLLCEALERLSPDLALEITFVGDGQEAPILERFIEAHAGRSSSIDCSWRRDWHESVDLIELIARADLCLGVFGSGGKSARVWPFKNYMYLACGRPLVSADTAPGRRLLAGSKGMPFLLVDTHDSDALTECLTRAARRPELVEAMREDARACHETQLSGRIVRERFVEALTGGQSSPR